MNDTDVDVIVAGGGPIGLAAAVEARLAGFRVALVEPRGAVIDKACGEGLMPGALPLLARLGVDPPGMTLRGVSYRAGGKQADYRFAGSPGRGVRRTALHSALSERTVELGVEHIRGRVQALEQDTSGVTVTDAEGRQLRGSWLFAADGLHSGIRHLAGLALPTRRSARRYGLRQHFAIAPWSDLVEVYWGRAAEVYVTPVAEDTVGIAILGPQRTDFVETIAGLPALAERLRDATPASSLRGAGPFRQVARRPSNGRVLLVGDASGYVDAITGEGLRVGLEQAHLAVEHATGGAPYDAGWARATRDFRRLTSGLVRVAGTPLRGAIVPAASAFPRLYGSIVERLAR